MTALGSDTVLELLREDVACATRMPLSSVLVEVNTIRKSRCPRQECNSIPQYLIDEATNATLFVSSSDPVNTFSNASFVCATPTPSPTPPGGSGARLLLWAEADGQTHVSNYTVRRLAAGTGIAINVIIEVRVM